MTETYRVLKYYLITTIIIILLTIGMCALFLARANTEFMLFG